MSHTYKHLALPGAEIVPVMGMLHTSHEIHDQPPLIQYLLTPNRGVV